MNWIKTTYRKIIDHLGKLLSAAGVTLVGMDLAGMADQLKYFAGQYLGDKPAQKVGIALFILLFIRTAYTGWQHSRETK